MRGSSESGWRKSDSSRVSDAFAPSDRDLWVHHASRISLSPDVLRDSFFRTGRELKGQAGQAPGGSLRDQVVESGSSGVTERKIPGYPFPCSLESGDVIVSLRQWLDNPGRLVDGVECLHIFRQIVEIISTAHSQVIVVSNVRPSCFVMSSINRVSFIESASCSDSGSDSPEEESDNQSREAEHLFQDLPQRRARSIGKETHSDISAEGASHFISGSYTLE